MNPKAAKGIAENIALIAGNVAHIALIDAGAINDEVVRPYRADACAKIEKCKGAIAQWLQQPMTFEKQPKPTKGKAVAFGLLKPGQAFTWQGVVFLKIKSVMTIDKESVNLCFPGTGELGYLTSETTVYANDN